MRINAIGANPTSLTTQETTFKGNFSDQIMTRISSATKDRFVSNMSIQIHKSPKELSKYFTRNSHKRAFALYMAKKMSYEAFQNGGKISQENICKFDELFYTVRKPTKAHLSVAHRSEYSFDDTYKIFTAVQNDPDKKSLLNKLIFLKDYKGYRVILNPDTLLNLLKSDSAKELNKDFNKYSSYIALNYDRTDVSQTVLNGIKNTNFDTKKYNQLAKLKELRENSNILQVIPEEEMLKHYNPNAKDLFSLPSYKFHVLKKGTDPDEVEFLLNIYKTTNNKNVKNRRSFFKNSQGILNPENTKENILSFFNKIENDSNFKKLYEKIHSKGGESLKNLSTLRLSFLADKFGAKTLIKHFDNLNTIMGNSQLGDMDEIVNVLSKNLSNRFYHTSREKQHFKNQKFKFIHSTNFTFMEKPLDMLYRFKFETMPQHFNSKKPLAKLNDTKFQDYQI